MTKALVLLGLVWFGGCRQDGDDGEEELKWSCARVQESGAAVATPECLTELQAANSRVLKFYKAIPQMSDGKVVQYTLVEKRQPEG